MYTHSVAFAFVDRINARDVDGLYNFMPEDHTVTVHADHFASGVYFYRLQTDRFSQVHQMLVE